MLELNFLAGVTFSDEPAGYSELSACADTYGPLDEIHGIKSELTLISAVTSFLVHVIHTLKPPPLLRTTASAPKEKGRNRNRDRLLHCGANSGQLVTFAQDVGICAVLVVISYSCDAKI